MILLIILTSGAWAFVGLISGIFLERRHRRRLELARVMFRSRRDYANHGGE